VVLIFFLSAVIQISLPFVGRYQFFFGYFSSVLFLASLLIWYLFIKYQFLGINLIIQKGTVYLFMAGLFIFAYIFLIDTLLPVRRGVLGGYFLFLGSSLLIAFLYVRYSDRIIDVFYGLFFKKERELLRKVRVLEEELDRVRGVKAYLRHLQKGVQKLFHIQKFTRDRALADGILEQVRDSREILFVRDHLELDPYERGHYSGLLDHLHRKKYSGMMVLPAPLHPVAFRFPCKRILKGYERSALHDFWRNASQRAAALMAEEEMQDRKNVEAGSLFTSSIIHDLKNIITFLSLFKQNLSELRSTRKNEKMMRDSLKENLARLFRIKNRLLFVDKTEPGQQRIQLNPFLKRFFKENQFVFRGIKLKTDLRSGVVVQMDRENLLFVLENIFLNAAESIMACETPPKSGEISVRTAVIRSRIELRIRDNGRGFSRQEISELLTPFRPAGGSHQGGLGIGLYTCSRLLRQNHCELQVRGEKNQYAEIIIEFPQEKT